MQIKVNVLVRLREAMQAKWKTASYSEPIQILTFLHSYLINGFECTVQNFLISLNTLFELHMKSKKVGEILAKRTLKKGKAITTETLHLVTNVFEDDNFSR